jgi:hypothetical protein
MNKLAFTLVILALTITAAPARAQTHSVALSWTASASAAANPSLTYNVYRSPGCSGTFTLLNSSAVSATSFTDAGLSPGTYCYQITALLSGVESMPSNQAAAIVPGPTPPRAQPGCTHRGPLIGWLRCIGSQPKNPKP